MDVTNLVVLRGALSSEPDLRTLPSGSVLVQLNVTTDHPDGRRSVPVAWFDPPATAAAKLTAGTEVIVAGHVRRRYFRAAATTQSRTEVVVERLALAARPRDVARLTALVVDAVVSPDAFTPSPPVGSVGIG